VERPEGEAPRGLRNACNTEVISERDEEEESPRELAVERVDAVEEDTEAEEYEVVVVVVVDSSRNWKLCAVMSTSGGRCSASCASERSAERSSSRSPKRRSRSSLTSLVLRDGEASLSVVEVAEVEELDEELDGELDEVVDEVVVDVLLVVAERNETSSKVKEPEEVLS